MDEITAKGIEVRYIAWPRGDQLFPAMESIGAVKTALLHLSRLLVQLPAATCKLQFVHSMNWATVWELMEHQRFITVR